MVRVASAARFGCIWYASVDPEHRHARLYNEWTRTAYLHKDEPFPDPRESFIDIAPHEVIWRWLDNANQKGPSGTIEVTLTDLHPPNDRRDV